MNGKKTHKTHTVVLKRHDVDGREGLGAKPAASATAQPHRAYEKCVFLQDLMDFTEITRTLSGEREIVIFCSRHYRPCYISDGTFSMPISYQ